jgi:hypothetical protein
MKDGAKHVGRGQTSARLKKSLGVKDGEIHTTIFDNATVKKVKIKLMGLIPNQFDKNRKSNILSTVAATAEHLLGENQSFVEKKYKLGKGEVANALRMFFPSKEDRLNALSNILLDNALIASVKFQEKKKDLTVMQAAIAAGLFTDKFVQLQKAQTSGFKENEVPVNLILKLEQTLAHAKEVHGKIIDI